VCIRALSTRVTLPERVDVLLSDLRGVLPFHCGSVESVVDARERFLKPDGLIIPRRDTLWAAVAQAPKSYDSIVRPWTEPPHGLDLRRGRELAVNNWRGDAGDDDRMLSAAVEWGVVDYATVRDGRLTGTVVCPIARPARAHGMFAWFDTELIDGVAFSNVPGGPKSLYGRAFFPWPEPYDLAHGDVVETTFRVMPGRTDSEWTWETRIRDGAGVERANFRQSTFLGQVLPSEDMKRRADSHTPTLSIDGRIDRDILLMVDGHHTLRDIAVRLRDRYPDLFPDWQAALGRVAETTRTNEHYDCDAR
jgi:hypothetical protein